MTDRGDKRWIGIMAHESEGGSFPPFGEREFYARLCEAGWKRQLNVYVFSPLALNEERRMVRGFSYNVRTAAWQEGWFPLPDLVYDRAFFTKQDDYPLHKAAVRRLNQLKPITYLGRGLKNKWQAYVYLRRDPRLLSYLPRTAKLTRPELAVLWLADTSSVFLKPDSGSQGCGTVKVERIDGTVYRVKARDRNNQPLNRSFESAEAFCGWLAGFTGNRPYLIQQYLELQPHEGGAWDIRALVQKNGQGLWELAGTAVRQGDGDSITSNIHGGGQALAAGDFLRREFGEERATAVEQQLRFLTRRIPRVLEGANGRMAELGLDLGVDRDGRVWIIEVNTKPGRSVFRKLGMKEASLKANTNPIAYAGHLLSCTASAPGVRAGRVYLALQR